MLDTSWDPWDPKRPESFVFGTDDRFAVSAERTQRKTRDFPFNTICILEDSQGWGSGTLIAPQVVLTARHVNLGLPMTVTPAADFAARTTALARPFGQKIVPVARWRPHPTLDIGLLFLRDAFPHRRFMLLQPRTARNTLTTLTVAGYPIDRTRGTMWAHSDRIVGVSPAMLTYRIDTAANQSGSPVWLLGNDGYRILLGVHVGFRRDAIGNPDVNQAVRITCEVIDWIRARCRDFSVTAPVVDRAYGPACTGGNTINDSAP